MMCLVVFQFLENTFIENKNLRPKFMIMAMGNEFTLFNHTKLALTMAIQTRKRTCKNMSVQYGAIFHC